MRIQRIQVKRNHPVMGTHLRCLDICSLIPKVLVGTSPRRHHNVLGAKVMITNAIPHLHLGEHIIKVHLCRIRERNCHLNEFHFIIKAADEFHILYIILNEFMIISFIQCMQGSEFVIGQLALSEFHMRNIVQTITLLVCICKLLIHLKIVEGGNPGNVNHHLFLAVCCRERSRLDKLPR